MQVREANLDDVSAICTLCCSQVEKWQRINTEGQVEDLPYADLTLGERYLHGGVWMSIEMGAIWLRHLRRSAGIPLLVEIDGKLAAYAEAFHSIEPPPFGEHHHLHRLVIHSDVSATAVLEVVVTELSQRATSIRRISVSFPEYDTKTATFYQGYGFSQLARVQRFHLPAQTGQAFYKAVDHSDTHAHQITEWHQSIGRLTSSREAWETTWYPHWDALPDVTSRHMHRAHMNAAGQVAFVCLHQQLYQPRNADVYCWSPKPLTSQLLIAIRDWAHRQNYRSLTMAIPEDTTKLFAETQADPHAQVIFVKNIE